MNKLFATLVLTSILLVPTIMSAYAYSGSSSATGSVTIAGTCGVALGDSTINYGTVTPGSAPINANSPLGINNTGSVTGTLTVTGADWLNTPGTTSEILASNTGVSTIAIAGPYTPLANGIPIPLSGTFAPNPAPHTSSLTTYWQLTPILENLGFTGSLTQSLTFSASC